MSRRWCLASLCAVLLFAGSSGTTAAADPILRWNKLAIDAVAADHSGTFGAAVQGGPTRSARALAIVHLAMFDAANSCEKRFTPYRTYVPAVGQVASVDAAVAQAGHDTLVSLYPKMATGFDAALKQDLNAVSNIFSRTAGVGIGKLVAKALLDARAKDGSATDPIYKPGTMPGQHRPDPLHLDQGFNAPGWGLVKPFALQSGSQFRSPPPPALNSPAYAQAYKQILQLGGDGVNSATQRTTDQTLVGIFCGYDGTKNLGTPPRLYNQVARTIAEKKKNDVFTNARLFALLNLSMADAGIACWETKYYYNYWRPILGVREADAGTGPSKLGDNNPNTKGDVKWTPLGAPASNRSGTNFTPPFPSYPSGHATFGAALCQTLRIIYGTDQIEFDFVSDECNGVTTDANGVIRPLSKRHYTNLTQIENENAISRIYLGIHWIFDATAGVTMGRQVTDYAAKNFLKPL